MLNGPDVGTKGIAEIDFGGGILPTGLLGGAIGWDADVSFLSVTEYYYLGNSDNLYLKDFEGLRHNVAIGASYWLEGGFGVPYMPLDKGGTIVGITRYIGASLPGISGNYNKGRTGTINIIE